MSNVVLWRRLTQNDFNAMHGHASLHGRGGGARHISLGVRTDSFPVDSFLDTQGRDDVTVNTQPAANVPASSLTFRSIPTRRGGEWMIADQHGNRHPAWATAVGFPTIYNGANPPYILVFRVHGAFHVRFTTRNLLQRFAPTVLPAGILAQPKGIEPVFATLLGHFGIPASTLAGDLQNQQGAPPQAPFDPQDIADGRRRIMAEVIRRSGQPRFRADLLQAYASQCVISRCAFPVVLEAAHISPYRGPETNTVPNGLLLRADIHTLFDLALISIEPGRRMRIRVAPQLAESDYAIFEGRAPHLPDDETLHPSPLALAEHFSVFQNQ